MLSIHTKEKLNVLRRKDKRLINMASDRGHNRHSDFVASERLTCVENCFSFFVASFQSLCVVMLLCSHCTFVFVASLLSLRVVKLFVSSYCFLPGVIHLFELSCSSFRRRRYKQVSGNSTLPTNFVHVIKTRWRER